MRKSSFAALLVAVLFAAGIPAGALADENTDGGFEKSLSSRQDLRSPIGTGSMSSGKSSESSEDVEVVEWGGVRIRVGIDDGP